MHPSADEGFGLTLAEAMASGVAVLAVRNPGTHELCGPAALLVEPDGLADGMARLHEERGPARRAGARWAASARGASRGTRARACTSEAYSLAAMHGGAR